MDIGAANKFIHLLYDVGDGVATVTLNRPHKKNALSKELWIELILALRSASNDSDVVVCVITGVGDYYSSGNDLANFIEAKKSRTGPDKYMRFENEDLLSVMLNTLINYPKPVIAAVNSPAIGIAVTSLGLMDVVYASDKATFLTPFISLGQSPEACSSYTFPKIMGPSMAYEVLYFGRKLSAQEARQCSLISDVFPHETFQREVQARAVRFAALPRKTLMAAKNLCRQTERSRLREVLKKERDLLTKLLSSEECREAVQNFFTRKSKM